MSVTSDAAIMSLFKLVRSFVDPTASTASSTTSTPLSPLSLHSHSGHDIWRSPALQLSPTMTVERPAAGADSMHDEPTQPRSNTDMQSPPLHRESGGYAAAVNRSLKHRWESHVHTSRSQRRRLHSANIDLGSKAQPLVMLDDDDADSEMVSSSSEEDSKFSPLSSQSSSASVPSSFPSISASTGPAPSVAVRVSMSVAADFTAMLAMGYSLRQARYATRLFSGDEEQALLYLLDMEQYRDALEIQIVQAELEAADEKDRDDSGGSGKRRASPPANSTSTWMRIFPRFTALSNTLASLSPQSASLTRAQSQPLPGDHISAHSSISYSMSTSPSPIPVDDPAAPLSRIAVHPPVLVAPAPPSSPFACDKCTYVNEALGTVHCEMCGKNRPESIEQRNWSASLRQCGICFDSLPLSSICTSKAPCAHLFCWSCFHSYLLTQLDENKLLDLRCPEPSCSRPILSSEVKAVVSPYHYARYRRFRQSAILAADPRVRYCPNRRCQNILYGSADNPRMHCDKCGDWSCYTCQIPWHEGLSCLQVLRHTELRGPTADDVAFLQSMHAQLGSRYRQCAGCGVWVERSAGCAKMTCRCGARWCFECGVINATCNCTPRYHVFYPVGTVLNNWNDEGPG